MVSRDFLEIEGMSLALISALRSRKNKHCIPSPSYRDWVEVQRVPGEVQRVPGISGTIELGVT